MCMQPSLVILPNETIVCLRWTTRPANRFIRCHKHWLPPRSVITSRLIHYSAFFSSAASSFLSSSA